MDTSAWKKNIFETVQRAVLPIKNSTTEGICCTQKNTYTLLWSIQLNKLNPLYYNDGDEIVTMDITADGEIIYLFSNEDVRGMGLATYLVRHVAKSYSTIHVRLPRDSKLIPFFSSCNVSIIYK
jgi:hypothetical protein